MGYNDQIMKKGISTCAVAGILGLALLLGAGPATAGTKVDVGHDPNVDFTAFRTYAWAKGTPAGREEIQAAVVAAIERELDACGLVKTGQDADLLIESHAFGSGNPGLISRSAWGEYFGVVRVDIDTSTTGTLWVDLVEANSNEPVWSAAARADFTGKLDKVPARVDKIVSKMFRKYPTK